MLKRRFAKLLLLASTFIGTTFLLSWGVWGHEHINRAAVFALPEDMRRFFYNHIDFITEESTVPDIRKYTIGDNAEPQRHYINPESFTNEPLDNFPQTMQQAKARFGDSALQKNGLLPWYIQEITEKLTNAFKLKRKTEILFLAGDLAHYIGDAHMPLHSSVNHDGQLTNQRGIHAFFESQLPEMFGENYNFYTSDAAFIPDITKETWRIIKESHQLADTLLLAERNLKNTLPVDKMYDKDASGNILKNKFNQPVHSHDYAVAFHNALNGMVERQLRKAVVATASYWYTAWVNAGKPNLDDLDPPALTERNSKSYKKDYKLWTKGKLFGFKVDREF